jgi:hypothetical protein
MELGCFLGRVHNTTGESTQHNWREYTTQLEEYTTQLERVHNTTGESTQHNGRR